MKGRTDERKECRSRWMVEESRMAEEETWKVFKMVRRDEDIDADECREDKRMKK